MIHGSCARVPAVKHLSEAALGPASRELKIFKQLTFLIIYFRPVIISKNNNNKRVL